MELKSATATLFLAIFQTIFVAEARGPQQVNINLCKLSFGISQEYLQSLTIAIVFELIYS